MAAAVTALALLAATGEAEQAAAVTIDFSGGTRFGVVSYQEDGFTVSGTALGQSPDGTPGPSQFMDILTPSLMITNTSGSIFDLKSFDHLGALAGDIRLSGMKADGTRSLPH